MSDFTLSVTPKLSENMHNIYIQVIVAHGALAFICFAAYLIIVVLKNLKFLFGFNSDNENNKLIFKLVSTHFCLIGSFLIVNLFDSNILYFCSIFLVPAFWNSISTINGLIDCLEREDDKKKVLLMVDSLEAGGTEKALIAIGEKELTDIIETEEEIEMTCSFCDKVYKYTKSDLTHILKKAKK